MPNQSVSDHNYFLLLKKFMSWKYVHTQFPSTSGQMNAIYSSLSPTSATCNIFHKKACKNNCLFTVCMCTCVCLVNKCRCAQPLPLLVQQRRVCWQTCVMRTKKRKGYQRKGRPLFFFFLFSVRSCILKNSKQSNMAQMFARSQELSTLSEGFRKQLVVSAWIEGIRTI